MADERIGNIYIISLSDVGVRQLEKIMPHVSFKSPDAYISTIVEQCIGSAFNYLRSQGVVDTYDLPKEVVDGPESAQSSN